MIVMGAGGKTGPARSFPGEKTDKSVSSPPHFTHTTYDIFKKKKIENIENACDIKFDVANCYISHRQ